MVIIHSYNVTVIDYGTIHAGVGDFVFIIAEVPIGEEEVYISRFESHPKITNAIREGEPPEEE